MGKNRVCGIVWHMYNTLVIDPPWPISLTGNFKGRNSRKDTLPYKTMSLKEIEQFPIKDYANIGAHIYLWTTNKYLNYAFNVLKCWNASFHLVLVGTKQSGIAPNCGYVFATEFCLLAFFGRPAKKWKTIGKLNHFQMKAIPGKHSAKPDKFYSLVEEMSPGPYIDIFSRKDRTGWSVFGDETGKFNDSLTSNKNYV